MCEEIEWLDEELTNLTAELTEEAKQITSKEFKKLSKGARADKFAAINERLTRARDVLSSYRVELQQVRREVGKGTYAEYEAKGKEHMLNVNKLAAEVETAKKAAETRDLMEGAKKKKKKGEPETDPNSVVNNEIVEEGKRIQHKTFESMARTNKLMNQMEEMGCEANLQLRSQTEQIKSTNSEVNEINEGMVRATKQLRDIGRRLATDKMIVCLVLMLLAMIVGIVTLNVLGYNPVDDIFSVDCTLDHNKTLKTCIEQQMALDDIAKNNAGGAGGGGGSGGSGSTNSTRRFHETAAAFTRQSSLRSSNTVYPTAYVGHPDYVQKLFRREQPHAQGRVGSSEDAVRQLSGDKGTRPANGIKEGTLFPRGGDWRLVHESARAPAS